MSFTLTPKLTLTGTAAHFGDELALSVQDTLTVGPPIKGISKESVLHTGATTILDATNTVTTYVYLKNTDTTNHVKIYTGNDELFGIVWPSQFSFFSIIDGEGLKLQANNATCIVEYAYYTKA
tara:strand:- start:41 stop:409 length:369 start_codon:yes stop_codon:yes gene_type:complete